MLWIKYQCLNMLSQEFILHHIIALLQSREYEKHIFFLLFSLVRVTTLSLLIVDDMTPNTINPIKLLKQQSSYEISDHPIVSYKTVETACFLYLSFLFYCDM